MLAVTGEMEGKDRSDLEDESIYPDCNGVRRWLEEKMIQASQGAF